MEMRIKNRLLAGGLVTISQEAKEKSSSSWIAIYPIDVNEVSSDPILNKIPIQNQERASQQGLLYLIHDFEIQNKFLNEYCGQDDIETTEKIFVTSLEELAQYISGKGLDTNKLQEPWKDDFPL